MSRIGKLPIKVPDGVTVSVTGRTVSVEGPQGKLSMEHRPEITVTVDSDAGKVIVERADNLRESKAYHGLTRALVANMVEGVTKVFEKALEIHGVGFGAKLQGQTLELTLGYADTRRLQIPEGVIVELPSAVNIVVKGPDKQKVGQFAAEVRATRKPEPYLGKGVRYRGEQIRRKAGKAFAGTGAA